jgi:putative intracellular protease/amidase
MASVLQGKRIAILATDGVERRELERPRAALSDAGADIRLLSLKPGTIDARDHDLQPAGEFTVDREVSEASVEDFSALVIPGGTVNADKLRSDRGGVCARLRRVRQTGGRHMPWPVGAGRGRCRQRPHVDVLLERAYRPSQCGCQRR